MPLILSLSTGECGTGSGESPCAVLKTAEKTCPGGHIEF
jgi:hypothetical protein